MLCESIIKCAYMQRFGMEGKEWLWSQNRRDGLMVFSEITIDESIAFEWLKCIQTLCCIWFLSFNAWPDTAQLHSWNAKMITWSSMFGDDVWKKRLTNLENVLLRNRISESLIDNLLLFYIKQMGLLFGRTPSPRNSEDLNNSYLNSTNKIASIFLY